ncbi:hypothetical protein [Picosynechococcus sp. PCC 7117]|uniref:hypothetical protein n=1 Tax=Picosynechococcus sp. PCC 7117 TaxID=195498 RepID=UPI000810B431|nr:hypothetical protein [Picosynechococcus sp. PCC 7117]ANV86840.1 hypothetical protein AWQ22_04775 [Picosynechococcus sp. PCC 7117]
MKKMLGLAMTLFVASPAFAGNLLKGEPYYDGLYAGEPLTIDIEPDPFDSEPTIRANFFHSIEPFYGGSTEIDITEEFRGQSSIFETEFSQNVVSGSMTPIDGGVEFENYTVESQYSYASEFTTRGSSTTVKGSAETYGTTFIFESNLSVEF